MVVDKFVDIICCKCIEGVVTSDGSWNMSMTKARKKVYSMKDGVKVNNKYNR